MATNVNYSYIEKIIVSEHHTYLISHEINIENNVNHIIFHVGADMHKHDDVTIIMPNCCKYFAVRIKGYSMLIEEFDPTKE